MNQKEKLEYLPPQARLICFQPMERIATEEGFDDTMSLFSGDQGISTASVSFEVTDPDFPGWD